MENKEEKPVSKPRDQMWLQEAAELVNNKMPETHTFVIFAFPIKGSDRVYYSSKGGRSDVIEALKQWIAFQEADKDRWLEHDTKNRLP